MDSDGYKDEYEEDDIPHRQQGIWNNCYIFKIKQEQIGTRQCGTLPKGISVYAKINFMPFKKS